jgi:hypothetical protein
MNMHVDTAFPSKFLRASDLQGQTANVLIERYAFEEIGGDRKLVLFFKDVTKGLVTNKTNAQAIAMVYGPEMDDWQGGEVQLYTAMVDFQGKQTEAIRIRIPPRKPAGNQQSRPVNVVPNARARAEQQQQQTEYAGGGGAPLDDEIPFAPEWR